jgi:thioredoxin reductase
MQEKFDAVVIGGGPAGLAAALWLARYKLRTCVFDSDDPRNSVTWGVHGYLGLDDPAPAELRNIGREQATRAGARIEAGTVVAVEGEVDRFVVKLEDGRNVSARRVLFATGMRDIIPEIPGLLDFYGTSIWHCPDCDGPTVEGLRVGVIGWGRQIAAFCMEMLTWTNQLTLYSHGRDPELPEKSKEALDRFNIRVIREPLARIEGEGERLQRVVFENGETQELDALFFHIAFGPGCAIPADLGCEANDKAILKVDEDGQTTVPGIYAAGDITPGSKLAIKAAAEGTRAAIGVYRSLLPEDRKV